MNEENDIKQLKEKILSFSNNQLKGYGRFLKYNFPNLYTKIIDYQNKYKLKNSLIATYWYINNITQLPLCKKCQKRTVKWQSFKEGYLKICGICEGLEKQKQTNLEKYGVEHTSQLKDVMDKVIKTRQQKYTKEEWRQKYFKTMEEKYGSLDDFYKQRNEKTKQTSLKKYGAEHYLQNKENFEKVKKSLQEKYGKNVTNVMHIQDVKERVSNSLKYDIEYVKLFLENKNYELLSEYKNATSRIKLRCKICNFEFITTWNTIQQGGYENCPKCNPTSRSKPEIEIEEFLKENGINNIISNDRQLIHPFELDIVLPDHKLAIEYCGLIYHSSGGKNCYTGHIDKNYHLNKLNLCKQKGYRLITIFEDEWLLKKNAVLSKLCSILNLKNKLTKIRAHKCQIKEIPFQTKHEFLIKYHFQNDSISNVNLGLYYENQLISVMTFRFIDKNKKEFELLRFCTLPFYIVYGGASKLLKYFEENCEWNKIITYADKRYSNGNIYFKLGFEYLYDTDPNYWYWGKDIVGKKHRLNYMKANLIEMENYDENLTEFEIMEKEGYNWIYDCGNMKFEKIKGD